MSCLDRRKLNNILFFLVDLIPFKQLRFVYVFLSFTYWDGSKPEFKEFNIFIFVRYFTSITSTMYSE